MGARVGVCLGRKLEIVTALQKASGLSSEDLHDALTDWLDLDVMTIREAGWVDLTGVLTVDE